MSQPYIGEIRLFAGNFAPAGWALCDGQLVPISENDALFTLIGTTYGGDGQNTFALPDLRGRIPIHQGQGAGTGNYILGQNGGVEDVTLTTNQLPVHTHPARCRVNAGTSTADPANAIWASSDVSLYGPAGAMVQMGTPATSMLLTVVGGSLPHENMSPFLCIHYIISLFGIFPTQN